MARIYSPNENHSCDYGIDFFNGVAVLPDSKVNTLARLEAIGYTIVTGSDELMLWDYLTKVELVKLADFLRINSTDLGKVEIVAAIENRLSTDLTMDVTAVEAFDNINGGTFVEPVYLTAEAIIEALPTSVTCIYGANNEEIELNIIWEDTDDYEIAAGSYTFTGTVETVLPFSNKQNLTSTVEVVVSTVNIKGVETLANVDGGTVASPTYVDATAVIAVLPAKVDCTFGEAGVVEADVTWADTDNYDADASAGSYTFTGTLVLPAGYTNTDALTATVEVIVAAE